MKSYALTIGIDVSKAKLDACIMRDATEKDPVFMVVANSPKGMAEILARIRQMHPTGEAALLFCFENTGLYSTPLSLFLEQQGIDYWMVPAIEIKKSKGITRGKKDKTDARDIALYALTRLARASWPVPVLLEWARAIRPRQPPNMPATASRSARLLRKTPTPAPPLRSRAHCKLSIAKCLTAQLARASWPVPVLL